jgi:hypothetical protein
MPLKYDINNFSVLNGLVYCPHENVRQVISQLISNSNELSEKFRKEIFSYITNALENFMISNEYFQTILSFYSRRSNNDELAKTYQLLITSAKFSIKLNQKIHKIVKMLILQLY